MRGSYEYKSYACRKLRKSIKWARNWFSLTYIGAQVGQGEQGQDQTIDLELNQARKSFMCTIMCHYVTCCEQSLKCSMMCYECSYVISMMIWTLECDIKCYMMLCQVYEKYVICTSILVHVKCVDTWWLYMIHET